MGDRGIGSKSKGVFGSPGKDKKTAKVGEEEEDAPAWFTKAMTTTITEFKKSWSEEMKAHRVEIQREMQDVQERMERVEKIIREDVVKKSDLDRAVKETVSKEVAGMASRGVPMEMGANGMGEDALEEKRKLEMIIGGLTKDTPRQEVIAKVRNIMTAAGVQVENVFTFEKFGSIGVVTFPDAATKKSYKQWLATPEGKTTMQAFGDGTSGAWAGDNLGKMEREKRRALGKVKRALADLKGTGAGIQVDYSRKKVYVGSTMVAKIDEDGRLKVEGEASNASYKISEYLREIKSGVEVV